MVPQLKVVFWQLESDAWEGNDVVGWKWREKMKMVMMKMMVVEERDNIVCCSFLSIWFVESCCYATIE